ncbi:MAG: AAA family ATPase [Promethearchaeota archaeon]
MPVMIVPVGAAGCGKTTLYHKDYSSFTRISADDIRFEILNSLKTNVFFDLNMEPRIWREVWKSFLSVITKEDDIYLDATNLTMRTRTPFVSVARFFGYTIRYIIFKTTIMDTLNQNEKRERKVPENVICKQYIKMEPPELNELEDFDTLWETE